ncbi:MAG: gamma-glutamyl-gamma-aminobutyrate hydrolase family protein [Phycisphaeraceae bacterium]
MDVTRPIVGITPDTHTHKGAWRYELTAHYGRCVEAAGGVPVVLPYQLGSIGAYLELCDAFILAGGDDPDTQPFGEALHPSAKPVVPERQAFELGLLRALDATAHPVLGICLGMQWMALHHGGKLHQHLPDLPESSAEVQRRHADAEHAIVREEGAGQRYLPLSCGVFSHHHQAVADAGRLRVIACSDVETGSFIEAIDLPGERFYLGVQWHPERTADRQGGAAVFEKFIEACRSIRLADAT